MNDILNKIIKSTQTIKTIVKHPLKSASLEKKILYLNVLCLLHDEQTLSSNYLSILLSAVDVDLSMKQDFIDFSLSPDEETIVSFIQAFRHSDLAIPFLSDCLMLSGCEDKLEEDTVQFINRFSVELGIYGTKRDDLHKHFSLLKDSYFDVLDKNIIAEHVIVYFKPEFKNNALKTHIQVKTNSTIFVPKGVSGTLTWHQHNKSLVKEGSIIAWIKNEANVAPIKAQRDGVLEYLLDRDEKVCPGKIIGKYS